MSIVQGVLARVFVDDIDAALPLYRELCAGAEPNRFGFGAVQLCWIGSFLLLQVPSGERERYERVATVLVDDVAEALAAIERAGGVVLEVPAPAPNGARMIARHADGAVFEYIEAAQPTR